MFKKGDTAYFVFQGNVITGRYKEFMCLPTFNFNYFPFYPVTIVNATIRKSTQNSIKTIVVDMYRFSDWNMPIDLLEKEFSFDKFILAQLNCNKKISKAQFKMLIATL